MKNLFLTLIMTLLATQVMSFDVTIEDDYSYPQYGEYDYSLNEDDIGISNPAPIAGESVIVSTQIHNSGLCFVHGIYGWYSSNGRSAWAEWDFDYPVSGTIDITYRCMDGVTVDWRVELDGTHIASPSVPGCGSGLHWKVVTIHDVPISAGSHTIFLGTYQMDSAPDYSLDWVNVGDVHIEAENYDRMGGNDPNPDYQGLRISPMATNLLESYNLTVQVWDGNPNADGILLYENFVGNTNTVYDRWHCSPDNTITVHYIESGSQTILECEWIPEEPGEHDIYVLIDPNEVLGEIDETNNIAHRSVVVGGGNQTQTFYPSGDATIYMKDPGSNHGLSTVLITENRYGHPMHPEDWQKDVLINFDISSISTNTEILSATLNFFYFDYHDNNPAGRELSCYPITSEWNEETVTWNNQPTCVSQHTSSSIVPGAPEVWMTWDVTGDVQEIINNLPGEYFGWKIMDEAPWGQFDIPWTKFYSKEFGDLIPYLEIEIGGGSQPDCLVGYWKFEEGSGNTAYGSSGYENNCTLHGPQWNSGISGYALEFDGINDYTLIPDDPILNFNNTNQFTIELWIKRKGCSLSYDEGLISKITSAHKKGYGLIIGTDNTIIFLLGDGSTQHACKSEIEIVDTNWHHIVASWDGTTQYLYIDNELDNSIFIGDVTIANDYKPLEFGNHWGYTGNHHPFYGFMDEVIIYGCSYIVNEPDWEVVTGTQYNMTVLASIELFGDPFVADGNNMAAAFGPDGENDCRALAAGQDNLWNFTIVSNADLSDEEVISFKVYDSNSNTVYACNETILFENNAIIGTPGNPFPLTVTNIQNQEFDLAENWNWVSFNVHPDDTGIQSVFESLEEAVSQVKDQIHGATYYGEPPAWWGDLENISDGEGYLVNMNNPLNSFVVSGSPIEASTPIDLIENWNWLAYYPQEPLLIEDALASIEQNVFQVKNQTLSSTYFTGTGWVGDLTLMEPGIGYKIQMLNEDVLIYPDSPGGIKNDQLTQTKKANVPPNWKIRKGTMYNMVVVAKFDSDTEFEAAGTFNNYEDCASVATGFAYEENQLWYFTIVGNTAGEALNFKLYDEESGETYTCNETIQFSDNSTIGNPAEPLALTISENGIDVPERFILMQNYPNPFTDKTEISYALATASKVKLSVYGQLGREIRVLTDKYLEAGAHKVEFKRGHLHPGIYYYRLEVINNKGKFAKIRKLIITPR